MEKLLVSSCMLGVSCRYDGASKIPFSEDILENLRTRYELIPFCPEIYGGLPTPRTPSERVGDEVYMKDGKCVTHNYKKGADEALRLCRILGIKKALLKEKSPSCGKGFIYDGTFSKRLIFGNGVCAELLMKSGVEVFGESEIDKLI